MNILTGKYKVITLCGSTRFKNEFMKVQKEFTLAGNIVISVGCFGHSGDTLTEEQKFMLDDMHKRKIDMADEIFVINVGGYIGESTKSEIEYARSTGKPIFYLENPLKNPLEEVKIVAYNEEHLYLSNGQTIEPPQGYKYDPDVIKKILEAGD